MYADDTSLTFYANDYATLEEKLNEDINEIQNWLQSNKRTLNIKKSNYMITGSHYRHMHLNEDPCIGETKQQFIPRATTYEYLGIEVDEALGWQCQADVIFKKVSAGIGALKRIRPGLGPRETLLQMYEALVHPYQDYCCEIWCFICKIKCDRLHRLQNRAGRIIPFSDFNTRSAILHDLRWDNLEQR